MTKTNNNQPFFIEAAHRHTTHPQKKLYEKYRHKKYDYKRTREGNKRRFTVPEPGKLTSNQNSNTPILIQIQEKEHPFWFNTIFFKPTRKGYLITPNNNNRKKYLNKIKESPPPPPKTEHHIREYEKYKTRKSPKDAAEREQKIKPPPRKKTNTKTQK